MKVNFDIVVSEILYYITTYGIDKFGPKIDIKSAKSKIKFIGFCHEGFALAQKMIVHYILECEEAIEQLKLELKKVRQNRLLEKEKVLKNDILGFQYNPHLSKITFPEHWKLPWFLAN